MCDYDISRFIDDVSSAINVELHFSYSKRSKLQSNDVSICRIWTVIIEILITFGRSTAAKLRTQCSRNLFTDSMMENFALFFKRGVTVIFSISNCGSLRPIQKNPAGISSWALQMSWNIVHLNRSRTQLWKDRAPCVMPQHLGKRSGLPFGWSPALEDVPLQIRLCRLLANWWPPIG